MVTPGAARRLALNRARKRKAALGACEQTERPAEQFLKTDAILGSPMSTIEGQEDRKPRAGRAWRVLLFAALGAYLNAAAYGFQFPAAPDYSLFLPLANWTRDRSLYPGDALREAFPHMQTFFWPAVGLLSKHYSTEHVLLVTFIATKLIFFGAVGSFVAGRVRSRALGACMVAAIALSPLLNSQTPIGGTIILDEISEQAGLGLALVLLAGVLLADGKWKSAAIVAALSAYVDALHFLHALPAFVLLAVVDWRERRRDVIAAAALGAIVFLPWYVHFHASYAADYPSDYVTALLVNYPLHITLRWTPALEVLAAAAILLTAAGTCAFARRSGLKVERRLELIAASYFCIMSVGVLAGWFWLTPNMDRFMLPRADSLLIPYAVLLVQAYGASLLESKGDCRPTRAGLLTVLAILLPLSNYVIVLLLPAMLLWLNRETRLEHRFVAASKRWGKVDRGISITQFVAGSCGAAIIVSFFALIPTADQLRNFRIPPNDQQSACHDAEIWARDHTARDASFLVPPEACPFRAISERSTWGEWSDGNAMYFYPAFADTFLKRLAAFDQPPVPQGPDLADSLENAYKKWSWEHALAIARANSLGYVVLYKDVRYPGGPVYANDRFAIYQVK